MLSEPHTELKPGERILIAGEQRRAQSPAVSRHRRALALGKRPDHSSRRVNPSCSCRSAPMSRLALCARRSPTRTQPRTIEAAAIAKALADVGLEHLEPLLDKEDRWDRRVDRRREAMLGFCPRHPAKTATGWWSMTRSMSSIPTSRMRIEAIFTGALADIGIINIGHDVPESGFFTRHKLHTREGSARADLRRPMRSEL